MLREPGGVLPWTSPFIAEPRGRVRDLRPSNRALQALFHEGALPLVAVYGVWFYLPSPATNTGNWNLAHFQGGVAGGPLHNLWDISLRSADDGRLFAYLFDFLNAGIRVPNAAPAVPIGSWFHLEFRLRRASNATGEVALYQDGTLLMELTGLPTDDTDYGQWYVGNYADALTPPSSTIYVDDVTIRATLRIAEPVAVRAASAFS